MTSVKIKKMFMLNNLSRPELIHHVGTHDYIERLIIFLLFQYLLDFNFIVTNIIKNA